MPHITQSLLFKVIKPQFNEYGVILYNIFTVQQCTDMNATFCLIFSGHELWVLTERIRLQEGRGR